MGKDTNPIYEHNTLEFITVALEYCTLVETGRQSTFDVFIDKAVKILPLLYLKATLLPIIPEKDDEEDEDIEHTITEDIYEAVRSGIADLLGERDAYLETFHPDMRFSDTPIAAFISENLADIYQDVADFLFLFRQGNEEVMLASLIECEAHFKNYWGQQTVNALKALHAIRYDNENIENE